MRIVTDISEGTITTRVYDDAGSLLREVQRTLRADAGKESLTWGTSAWSPQGPPRLWVFGFTLLMLDAPRGPDSIQNFGDPRVTGPGS